MSGTWSRRRTWRALAAVLVVIALAFGALLHSSVQTWWVNRVLAERTQGTVSVGRFSASFSRIELTDLRVATPEVALVAPVVAADVSVAGLLWGERLTVSRLGAKGWTLTFPAPAVGAKAAAPAQPSNPSASPFRGFLSRLTLPVEVNLQGLELAGRVVGAPAGTVANVEVAGGGLGEGSEGRFTLTGELVAADAAVRAVKVNAEVSATLAAGRYVRSAVVSFSGEAGGPSLAGPVRLQGRCELREADAGETYLIEFSNGQRQLAQLKARYPGSGERIVGNWVADVRETDLQPFALGRALPTFAVVGSGSFEASNALDEVHALGRLEATVSRWEAIDPRFHAIGLTKLAVEFDLAERGGALAVGKFDLALDGEGRVATVRALQPFAFDPAARVVRPSDPQQDLLGITLVGAPLSWLQPFVTGVEITGQPLTGAIVASPREGGFAARTTTPLQALNLSVVRRGKPELTALDVSIMARGDFTPQGWQAELGGVEVRSSGRTLLLLDVRAGQLAGPGEPMKTTGLMSVDLAGVGRQPLGQSLARLTGGEAIVEFAASLADTVALRADVQAKRLTLGATDADRLPDLHAKIQAERDAQGAIGLNVPVTLRLAERESDLTLVGKWRPVSPTPEFEAQLSSGSLIIEDVKRLAALNPRTTRGSAVEGTNSPEAPAWPAWRGALTLNLQKVTHAGVEIKNVTGALRLSDGAVRFENIQSEVGQGGALKTSGALRFGPVAPATPLQVDAETSGADLDLAPWLRLVNPAGPAAAEGRFDLAARLQSRGVGLDDLLGQATGELELTSRSGVFRGLPVNVGNLVENSGKLAGWLAAAGNAITSLAGRRDLDEITSRSQAANELAKMLSDVRYDQLNISLRRDPSLTTRLNALTLISPELRITGSGETKGGRAGSMLNDPVAVEYRVRARGRAAELMRFLGILDSAPDELGYAGCTLPIRVHGTLARLDATEVSNQLVALAVEKSGLTDKAVEWLNRLRGR